jgi:hypothetical protein
LTLDSSFRSSRSDSLSIFHGTRDENGIFILSCQIPLHTGEQALQTDHTWLESYSFPLIFKSAGPDKGVELYQLAPGKPILGW